MAALDKTVRYINKLDTNIFIIADAKRGDIGNTSKMYARAVFGEMPFDAVTVAPYMGEDSITPFLSYPGKWAVILALTSNRGADDFQYHTDKGQRLFERVLTITQRWGTTDNIMYVVGATRAEMLADITQDSSGSLPACSGCRRPGWQPGGGCPLRHEQNLRIACELIARDHLR
ncbi:MAG: orotidine 5'-phosphate decarboxylase [Marinilabiliales bacterium]|nr:orotidine 5'-phosphate decarboxylase [Marinilabiliales bacterium]